MVELVDAYKANKGFGTSISRLMGKGGDALSDQDRHSIKTVIASAYDYSAAQPQEFWNWGLWSDELHRELVALIPNYASLESGGCSEQMYYYVLKQLGRHTAPKKPREILEIGCGSGPGLNFLSRIESQSRFVGVDISARMIDRAIVRYSRPGKLEYRHGDAESLPFPDNAFDAVINIESSHNYPNLGRFFDEVARVLRPGGYLSLIDIYTDERMRIMQRCIAEGHGLNWLGETDASELVKASIQRRMRPGSEFAASLDRNLPVYFRPIGKPLVKIMFGKFFASDEATRARMMRYMGLTAGLRIVTEMNTYRHFLAQKPA